MARYTGPLCRRCRYLGMKLYLKGEKCFTEKCPLERRNKPPGEPPKRFRKKKSTYSLQLMEKQKLREMYGILERQFRRYVERAEKMKGVSGDNLIELLERRLDNIIFRSGFAVNRRQARQMVVHRHFKVNGRIVKSPSYEVREGDVIELRKPFPLVRENYAKMVEYGNVAPWLEVNPEEGKIKVLALPKREDVVPEIDESLIIEYYSK